MSAFIVTQRTMDVVITALQDTNHTSSRRVFAGIVIDHDSKALDEIGRKLWDLNGRAVNGRYHGENPTDEAIHLSKTYRWTGTYWPSASRQGKLCRYVKALECLRYQCAEDATINDPIMAELADVIHNLHREIVHNLHDYTAAPWDFRPEHVPAVTRLI